MELIIDFYKSLDALNVIIFWGIIIVIILLLIFSCILITKNKKLKQIVETNNNKSEEELPIKKEELVKEEVEVKNQEDTTLLTPLPEEKKEPIIEEENIIIPIETEKKFVAEEHVINYNKELPMQTEQKNTSNYKEEMNRVIDIKPAIELPTAPYQRNVLREMSLSQTSPIGINKQENKVNHKETLAKDLEESLTIEEKENNLPEQEKIKMEQVDKNKYLEMQIKKDLANIVNSSPRKTEIIKDNNISNLDKEKENNLQKHMDYETPKIDLQSKYNVHTETSAKELLNNQPRIYDNKNQKQPSSMYLEEVSRKLAEAEMPDEIERTNYELQQEEDAIISYTELMKKKDSIQTIDEEDAIISIEELMQRNNQKTETQSEDERKLYNLTEEEENDNFIKELKQFRNDL